MLETDKAWFAGIIDGEGCISLIKRGEHFVPSVKISNTNELLINKCKQVLSEAGIEFLVRWIQNKNRKVAYYNISLERWCQCRAPDRRARGR